MKVDYILSAELKKKYKHRIRQCYKNAYTLLINKEIDFFIVGYIYEKNSTRITRHSWGEKSGKIIDSTFGNNPAYTKGIEYFESFRLNHNEFFKEMQNQNQGFLTYNLDAEQKTIDQILKKHNIKIIETD